jgi:DDE superfamily endonuclease
MDQLIPSLATLVAEFRGCFRAEVFTTFQALVAAWIVCPGTRTLSEVWQATGWAARRHHDVAYAVFRSAVWEWDDLGLVLASIVLAQLVPGGVVWLVVDDTLSHKRGAKVAFGGIFLDPVLSSKRHKAFRFGLNWVVLGIAVPLPFRPDRTFCLPLLWRVYAKKGQAGHRKRTLLAADLVGQLAASFPERTFWLVADAAYVNGTLLQDRPANVQVLGPLRWDAALYAPAPPRLPGQQGAPRKKGARLPTPRQMLADITTYPAEEVTLTVGNVSRTLRLQTVPQVLWYRGTKSAPVVVVLVRDAQGQWRDEALVATDPTVSAAFVVQGYCRRWSIEVAFRDSKQYLGLHDPQVRCPRSVERAHPLAWFVLSLTIVWYALAGKDGEGVQRDRPWYAQKKSPTFTDMLGALRLQQWQQHLFGTLGDQEPDSETLEKLLHFIAAVR